MTKVKCKICNSVLEVSEKYNTIFCNCGEIAIDDSFGALHATVKTDINNLCCIDEEGNEIIPKYKHEKQEEDYRTRQDCINELALLYKSISQLPADASFPTLNSDFASLLSLLLQIFRSS